MAWNKQTFIDPPTVSKWLATVIFIINIIAPGVGTIIIALLACSCEILIVGFLQLLTACLIVGWVWSIMWGWELMQISRRPRGGIQADSNLGPDGLL